MTATTAQELKYIVESLIFVAEGPLSFEKIKALLPDFESSAIREAITDLMAEYESRKNSFTLYEIAGGYQFRTKHEYKSWINLLVPSKESRLSKAALETLAIIAYKQPIIRSEIEHIRGVDSGGVLRILLEKNLIKILGRKEIPGRPLIYVTTKYFLEVFGLKDLKSLPTPKEIVEFQKPSGGDKKRQEQLNLPGLENEPDPPGIIYEPEEEQTKWTVYAQKTDENTKFENEASFMDSQKDEDSDEENNPPL